MAEGVADVFTAAAADGPVLDLRSSEYQSIGVPTALDRLVTLKVEQRGSGRRIGDVIAKRIRGQAARLLLETGVDPAGPDEFAAILADQWPVVLAPATRPRTSWTLTLIAGD